MSAARDYTRGYNAGSKAAWPAHKPPLPPYGAIREIMQAAMELRDSADNICSSLMEDDEFTLELSPGIDAVDEAMQNLTEWLRNGETK